MGKDVHIRSLQSTEVSLALLHHSIRTHKQLDSIFGYPGQSHLTTAFTYILAALNQTSISEVNISTDFPSFTANHITKCLRTAHHNFLPARGHHLVVLSHLCQSRGWVSATPDTTNSSSSRSTCLDSESITHGSSFQTSQQQSKQQSRFFNWHKLSTFARHHICEQ